MPPAVTTHKTIRPYAFHGVILDEISSDEAVGDCPFCGKSKFYLSLERTTYFCQSCQSKGNTLEFLRGLHERSMEETSDYSWISEDRGISEKTLRSWGVCKSILMDNWLVPGYLVSGKIGQLYRYIKGPDGKRRLMATPTLPQALYGFNLFDSRKPKIYFCEGPWDGMALQEKLSSTKKTEDGYSPTSNSKLSIGKDVNVLSVPGCTTFADQWVKITDGKDVSVLFDNDYPKTHPTSGKVLPPPAYSGLLHAVRVMTSVPESERPSNLSYLRWGDGGFSTDFPNGHDVRDLLKSEKGVEGVLERLKTVPEDWYGKGSKRGEAHIESVSCTSWNDLRSAWRKAYHWTSGMEGGLAVVLASIASVKALGEQLWIKLISPASGGKTTIAEAVSAAKKYVISDSGINGFYSGYKTDKEGTVDHSLAARLYDKTLVTKEGATLLASPMKEMILGQARDLYDGAARKTFNNAIRREYEGLRFTWILCGTQTLRSLDQSELGQRFIDWVIMEDIEDSLEDDILARAVSQQRESMRVESNCKVETMHDEKYLKVIQMTAGYIEHLKTGGISLLNEIDQSDRSVEKCARLGKFVAYMRARPSATQAENEERELGTRLAKQFVKLAGFLAVVTQRKSVDHSVMAIVKKAAMDTARGRTLEIARRLHEAGKAGLESSTLARLTNQNSQKEQAYLTFLKRIKVVEVFTDEKISNKTRWRLTPNFAKLYREVMV